MPSEQPAPVSYPMENPSSVAGPSKPRRRKKAHPKGKTAPSRKKTSKAAKKAALPKVPPQKAATRRKKRRNPAAPTIEAAFYRVGALVEFEYVDRNGEKRFVFNERPILCADSSGKLRVVYGAGSTNAKVPASIKKLHEVFNGYPARETLAGVFGKKIPGSQAMGVLKSITYHSDKCIDEESCKSPGNYRHAFEAPFPKVFVNPAGLLLIEGGSYEIGWPGILH